MLTVMQQQQERKQMKQLEAHVRKVLPPGLTLQSYGLSLLGSPQQRRTSGGRTPPNSAPMAPLRPWRVRVRAYAAPAPFRGLGTGVWSSTGWRLCDGSTRPHWPLRPA